MIKKYYILFFFAAILILLLQSIFVVNLHRKFIDDTKGDIDIALSNAISIESIYASHKDKSKIELTKTVISLNDMPKKMRDSILAIHPIPAEPPKNLIKEYDLKMMIDSGIIKNVDDIDRYERQDYNFEQGMPIDILFIDSLIDRYTNYKYQTQLKLFDSDKKLICQTKELPRYNYSEENLAVGLKKYQWLSLYVYIPTIKFVKDSIIILILSFMIVWFAVFLLYYFAAELRVKEKIIREREASIRGVIHDLKSPLTSVYTVLSWLNMDEKNPTKLGVIDASMQNLKDCQIE